MQPTTISVWIPGDQLLETHPAILAAEQAVGRAAVRVVLIESAERIGLHPYQRKKLVLLLSAMRHYAARLRERGYTVDYLQAPDFATGLAEHSRDYQPREVVTMAAAEYATRGFQHRLSALLERAVTVLPNTQFLIGRCDLFAGRSPDRPLILEQFYRAMRKEFGVLMDAGGAPIGGRWNYDSENRRPLPAGAHVPAAPVYTPDEITRRVMAEVAELPAGVGTVDGFAYAVTRADALHALEHFIARRLGDFGPYEDAMSSRHATLFHSALSPYLNIGLLEPLELIQAAEHAYHNGFAPIQSVEGFIRQVLGWREYIYWQYWRCMPELAGRNAWNAAGRLPGWFWDGATDLRCMQHVLRRAIDSGYSHHIERLMLICNFAMLAGLRPQEVNDWFLATYIDAYDWVMQPNVIGMGLNADGGRIATKPYIASANYISRMSDYCTGCRYSPKQRSGPDACPFNLLYWNFLIRHEDRLRSSPRFGPAVLGLSRLDDDERRRITSEAAAWLDRNCAAPVEH